MHSDKELPVDGCPRKWPWTAGGRRNYRKLTVFGRAIAFGVEITMSRFEGPCSVHRSSMGAPTLDQTQQHQCYRMIAIDFGRMNRGDVNIQ
jgi:hypothetical protein